MISTCPKCQKQVSIPSGVEETAAVRCPLCAAEYALGEAIALAPPELIVVSAVQAAPAVASVPWWQAAETAEPQPGPDLGGEQPRTERPAADDRADGQAAEPGPTDLEAAGRAAEQHGEEENDATRAASAESTRPSTVLRRSPGRPTQVLRRAIGVLVGGLLGCLIAYYALAFFYGPQELSDKLGLPQLNLPFLPRRPAPPAKSTPKETKETRLEAPGPINSS